MKTEINTIEDIFNSEEFNMFFDIENDKKEVEESGWNYESLILFGQELAKQL
jgi:hypothetical protein